MDCLGGMEILGESTPSIVSLGVAFSSFSINTLFELSNDVMFYTVF